jgi:hypothetical protein
MCHADRSMPTRCVVIFSGEAGTYMWGKLVIPAGFEPTTPGLGILCSILLSYGTSQGCTYQ